MKAKILLSVMMSTVLLLAPIAFAQRAGQDHDALARFQNALKRDGFDVTPGAAEIFNPAADYCAEKPGVTSALYNNRAPYLHLLVPKLAQTQETQQLVESFQLRPDEAVVLIGPTPPSVKYFGYYAFLSTRFLYTKEFPDGKRTELLGNLGDTVNNATVKTLGSTPFDRTVALIFTPDKGTDARIREALLRAGYPEAIMNTLVFPASMLNLGHTATADELLIAMRIGPSDHQAAVDSYVQDAQETLKVFRVTPRTEAVADPFKVPRLRVRGTGRTEMDRMNKMDKLRQGIIEANPGLSFTDITKLLSKPNFYEGNDYIQRYHVAFGNSRDVLWLSAGYLPEFEANDVITLADGEFLMVYGPNHVATGKAAYMNFSVYASEEGQVSIGQVSDDHLSGTARFFLPTDPDADLMYAYKISRSCGVGESNCLTLSIDNCERVTIDQNTKLGLIFRMYLESATRVGPPYAEILYDRVIKFSPPLP